MHSLDFTIYVLTQIRSAIMFQVGWVSLVHRSWFIVDGVRCQVSGVRCQKFKTQPHPSPFPSSVLRPPSSFSPPPSSVLRPPSSVLRPPSSVLQSIPPPSFTAAIDMNEANMAAIAEAAIVAGGEGAEDLLPIAANEVYGVPRQVAGVGRAPSGGVGGGVAVPGVDPEFTAVVVLLGELLQGLGNFDDAFHDGLVFGYPRAVFGGIAPGVEAPGEDRVGDGDLAPFGHGDVAGGMDGGGTRYYHGGSH